MPDEWAFRPMRAPAAVHDVVRSRGDALSSAALGSLEPPGAGGWASRSAHDFAQIRIHTDDRAAASAAAIGANAYTVGHHIVFGRGRYAPGTPDGRRLLAHELAHADPTSAGTPVPGTLAVADRRGPEEREARRAGERGHLLGPGPGRQRSHAALVVHRDTASDQVPTRVVGHGASAAAVRAAEAQIREVIGTLGAQNRSTLKGLTIELHIIPANKKLTDLPEYANLKGVRTWDRARVYDELRGVGAEKVGSVIRYAIAEEQLTKIAGKAPGYAPGFVGPHETGHVVEQFSLTKSQKEALKKAYDARLKAGGPWLSPASYTKGTIGEYFAQGTAAYFGHPYTESAADKKSYTKEWLRKNDPALFALLDEIYGAPAMPSRPIPPGIHLRKDFRDKVLQSVEDL